MQSFKRQIGDITQSTLTKQLRELEADGFDGVQYCLRLMTERCKIYPFQAIRLDKDIRNCELITRPIMLAALTEVLIEQYAVGGR